MPSERRATLTSLARGLGLCLLLLWSAAAPSQARADACAILASDAMAAQARVDLIQQAEQQIDWACWAFKDDPLSLTLLELLGEAAARQVRVRLIVDGLNNHIPAATQRRLLRCGVQIREYHPFDLLKPFWINRRLHDKLLVRDGRQMIIGSRNTDARNYGLTELNFVDCDVLVQGTAAAHAEHYFNCLWNSSEVRPARPAKATCAACEDRAHHNSLLGTAHGVPDCGGFVQLHSGQDWSQCLQPVDQVCFLHDAIGKKRARGSIHVRLLQAIHQARHFVLLETPYIVVSAELDRALLAARQRGARVVLVTNSLRSTNQILPYAAFHQQQQRLLDHGIEIWEYAGPHHLHAKTMLIDDDIAVISSYNFDPRSEDLNTEAGVLIQDAAMANLLAEVVAEHLQSAIPLHTAAADARVQGQEARATPARVDDFRRAKLIAWLIKRHL